MFDKIFSKEKCARTFRTPAGAESQVNTIEVLSLPDPPRAKGKTTKCVHESSQRLARFCYLNWRKGGELFF